MIKKENPVEEMLFLLNTIDRNFITKYFHNQLITIITDIRNSYTEKVVDKFFNNESK
jgi:hypothetical protein